MRAATHKRGPCALCRACACCRTLRAHPLIFSSAPFIGARAAPGPVAAPGLPTRGPARSTFEGAPFCHACWDPRLGARPGPASARGRRGRRRPPAAAAARPAPTIGAPTKPRLPAMGRHRPAAPKDCHTRSRPSRRCHGCRSLGRSASRPTVPLLAARLPRPAPGRPRLSGAPAPASRGAPCRPAPPRPAAPCRPRPSETPLSPAAGDTSCTARAPPLCDQAPLPSPPSLRRLGPPRRRRRERPPRPQRRSGFRRARAAPLAPCPRAAGACSAAGCLSPATPLHETRRPRLLTRRARPEASTGVKQRPPT